MFRADAGLSLDLLLCPVNMGLS